MKKIVAIFFLLIYSFTTVGATVHMHYCMGEYIGSNLYHTAKEECGKCGMKTAKSKDCCQDKHQFIQLKREHNQIAAAVEIPKFYNEVVVPNFRFVSSTPVFDGVEIIACFYSPPDVRKQKLHLLNCAFLI